MISYILGLFCGCNLEKFFPEKVADGSARLGVATAAVLVQMLKNHPQCNFDGEEVLSTAEIIHETPGYGTITYSLKDCVVDFPELEVISTDCNGEETLAKGKAIISAKQIRRGYIVNYTPDTGSAPKRADQQFVIPDGDDSVIIELESVQLDNFEIRFSSIPQSMRIQSGQLSTQVIVHLAESKTLIDLCSNPTPNLTFNHLNLQNIKATLPGIFGQFGLSISNSNIHAQIGTWKTQSNTLSGNMQLWNKQMKVNNDQKGLVPDFNEQEFIDGFLCGEVKETVAYPFQYQCNFKQLLAVNAARLVILNFATVGQESFFEGIDKSTFTYCGFDSFNVKTKPVLTNGNVGEMGSMQFAISDCRIGTRDHSDFLYDENCFKPASPGDIKSPHYAKTYVKGTAQIGKALMTVNGLRSKSFVYDSITPTAPDSLVFNFEQVRFNQFSTYVLEGNSKQPLGQLILNTGELKGDIHPYFSVKKSTPCAFDVSTPIAEFKNVQLRNANVLMLIHFDNKTLQIPLHIANSYINAKNGYYNGYGNYIWGSMTLGNETFEIPKPYLGNNHLVQVPLNPEYDQERFDIGYQCKPDLAYTLPPDHFENKCLL